MERERKTPSFVLGKGGPSLVDLRQPTDVIRLLVTGPGMLFSKLRLLTTVDVFGGATVDALHELAKAIEAIAICGHTSLREADVSVTRQRTGAVVDIDLGPANMYQSEVVLRTRTGETFEELLSRVFGGRDMNRDIVVLHPVVATGHLEHAHGTIHNPPDGQPAGHGHDHGGGHDHQGAGGGHGHP
jgi:hypothetical protein